MEGTDGRSRLAVLVAGLGSLACLAFMVWHGAFPAGAQGRAPPTSAPSTTTTTPRDTTTTRPATTVPSTTTTRPARRPTTTARPPAGRPGQGPPPPPAGPGPDTGVLTEEDTGTPDGSGPRRRGDRAAGPQVAATEGGTGFHAPPDLGRLLEPAGTSRSQTRRGSAGGIVVGAGLVLGMGTALVLGLGDRSELQAGG